MAGVAPSPGTAQGTVEPLTRASYREVCYAARDAFYACLTANGEDASKCGPQLEQYKASCMRSWRRHFDGKRKAAQRKELARKQMAQPVAKQ